MKATAQLRSTESPFTRFKKWFRGPDEYEETEGATLSDETFDSDQEHARRQFDLFTRWNCVWGSTDFAYNSWSLFFLLTTPPRKTEKAPEERKDTSLSDRNAGAGTGLNGSLTAG